MSTVPLTYPGQVTPPSGDVLTNPDGTPTNLGIGVDSLGGGLNAGAPTTGTKNTQTQSSGVSQSQNQSSLSTLLQTLSNISGKTASTGTQTGTTVGGYASPAATALSSQLANQYSNLANKSTNLQPYAAQQIQNINTNSQAQTQAQQAALAARGLSTSPVAGTVAAQTEASRVGQVTNLQQQLPLLQQQLQLQNLGAGNSFLANAPKTQAVTGTTAQTGTSSQTGNTSQSGTQTGSSSNITQQQGTENQQQQTSSGGGFWKFLGGLFSGAAAAG
jgi:hypothetical protein